MTAAARAPAARRWWAPLAWTGAEVLDRVVLEADGDRLTSVRAGTDPPPEAVRLPGIVVPGLVNAHSHAFHRALRGRTQLAGAAPAGDFWSWRERMYAVATVLDPDSYRRLARATYAEMALAGITTVGEFHYLHHRPGGRQYRDPNAMGAALVDAAGDAGVRLTLLDTCYLQADVDGRPLAGTQLRFSDGDADGWERRSGRWLTGGAERVRFGAAIHSVRAVEPASMRAVATVAAARRWPLHLHLSEQRRENAATMAVHGRTPAALAGGCGVLGAGTTAVHATHLADADIDLLGSTRTAVCFCPTTERDLADGVGPSRRLVDAGSPLCLGTDSHAVIDLFEEARGVELDERLVTGRRGSHSPASLLVAASAGGAGSLGWPEAGRLAPGATADFVAVRLDTARTAGTAGGDPVAGVVFAAGAADVDTVVVGGRPVVSGGRHLTVDVGAAMGEAIAEIDALLASEPAPGRDAG